MKEQRLLIIHQGSLGDFVLTFPAIALLKKSHRIDAVCQQMECLDKTSPETVLNAFYALFDR
jgi:ADP-heptose:LPS heptosyltransferase